MGGTIFRTFASMALVDEDISDGGSDIEMDRCRSR
jgi:hypothetical protein